ncbi:MAG: PAS domain-containing protein [Pseudomonadota bacterium]
MTKANVSRRRKLVLTRHTLVVWRPLRERALTYTESNMWPTGTAPAQEFCSEDERLLVLASFDLGELDGDPELARITRFAAQLCNVPSAAVSLVEEQRQLFLASEGFDVGETPRSTSFCAHTMLGADILEVLDATDDQRFADFALVTGDSHVRYYVGAPLISSEGAPMGALCITDIEPRSKGLNELQTEGLLVLAEAVRRRIEAHRYANRTTLRLKASADRLQFMLDSVPDIAWSASADGQFDMFNARWTEVTGMPKPKTVEEWRPVVHPDDFEPSVAKFGEAVAAASHFEDEWRMRMPDGSYRWMLTRAVPSSDDPETARWFGTITDIDERYRLSEERELLAGELAHRIKNVFSVITGLITMNARGDANREAFGRELADNILALSKAQDFALRMDTTNGENLQDLLTVLMAPYGNAGSSPVSIHGDEVTFGRRAATPLALIFHEMATNSAKYGALGTSEGKVSIGIALETAQDKGVISITWHEAGGPPVKAPEGEGFGSRLMRMTITNQLGGTVTRDWHEDGLVAKIIIPQERLAQ